MSEQARKSEWSILFECDPVILWITERSCIRFPLEPVLTFPPAGTKVFSAGENTLKPSEPVDGTVFVVNVTIEGGS